MSKAHNNSNIISINIPLNKRVFLYAFSAVFSVRVSFFSPFFSHFVSFLGSVFLFFTLISIPRHTVSADVAVVGCCWLCDVC